MHFTKINKNGKQCICMISYEYKSKGKNKDTLCIIPNRTIKLRKFKNHWYLGSIFFQDLFVAHFHLIVIRITEECCQMFLLVTIIWSCITSLTLTTENFHVRRGHYFLAPLLSQTPPFRCPARCSYSGFSREPPWQLCSPLQFKHVHVTSSLSRSTPSSESLSYQRTHGIWYPHEWPEISFSSPISPRHLHM